MFDELLNDYESQLEMFEETVFRHFIELDDAGLAPLTGPDIETGPVVGLIETGFTLLHERRFANLNLNRRL